MPFLARSYTNPQIDRPIVCSGFLRRNFELSHVYPESRLVDIGLTSMDMVKLMLDVEAEFDFMIPQPEITPENFQSAKTLEPMIVDQLMKLRTTS